MNAEQLEAVDISVAEEDVASAHEPQLEVNEEEAGRAAADQLQMDNEESTWVASSQAVSSAASVLFPAHPGGTPKQKDCERRVAGRVQWIIDAERDALRGLKL